VSGFPEGEQVSVRAKLAESLVGVVAQQLLRSKDGAGRVAAVEILVASSAVAAMIREGKSAALAMSMHGGKSAGMQTMDGALERLLAQGKIEAEEALDAALDKEAFGRIVGRTRPDLVDGLS
jgi:twitching motility protein PilT